MVDLETFGDTRLPLFSVQAQFVGVVYDGRLRADREKERHIIVATRNIEKLLQRLARPENDFLSKPPEGFDSRSPKPIFVFRSMFRR